ncbi:MAG: hypothetical protein AAFR56_20565, partial [Chloroflexota bacterium]
METNNSEKNTESRESAVIDMRIQLLRFYSNLMAGCAIICLFLILVTDDLTTPTVLIAFAIYALGLAFAATNHLQDRASVKEDMYLIVRTRSIRLMMFLFIFYVPASIHLAIISNSAVFVAIAIFSAGTALYMRRQLIMSTD